MAETLNLYLAVSEPLTEMVCDAYTPDTGVPETGCIAELVVARNRSQATWLAWQTDKQGFTDDVRDKPKFRCECKRKAVDGPPRIASGEKWITEADWCWKDDPDVVDEANA